MRKDNLIFSIGDLGNAEQYEEIITKKYYYEDDDFGYCNEFRERYEEVNRMIEKLQEEKRILEKYYDMKPKKNKKNLRRIILHWLRKL